MKGKTVPQGITEFYFPAAKMNFLSIKYDWLVVSGEKAIYQGTGKINGQGNYKFVISAVDGALKPKGSTDRFDKFRIKITDATSGNVVYDNQLNPTAPDDADPITKISAGFIITHT
jgi:hypothetical protein